LLKGTESEIKSEKNISSSNIIKPNMEIQKYILMCKKNSKNPEFNAQYKWDVRKVKEGWKPENNFFDRNNYGILCNKVSGLMGVDLDSHKWSEEQQTKWTDKFGKDYIKRFDSYSQSTPSGGQHIIFKYDPDFKQTQNGHNTVFGDGIDIRTGHKDNVGSGGFLIGAGSIRDGIKYKIIHDAPVKEIPKDLKDWLLENIYTKSQKKLLGFHRSKQTELKNYEDQLEQNVYSYSITPTELETEVLSKAFPDRKVYGYNDWLCFTSAMKCLERQGTGKFKEVWETYNKHYNLKHPTKGGEVSDAYSWKTVEGQNNNRQMWYNAQAKGITYYVEWLLKKAKAFRLLNLIKYKAVEDYGAKPNKVIFRKKLGQIEGENDILDTGYLTLKENDFVLLKSDTGTGKTTLVKNLLASNKSIRFSSIVSRISLAQEQYNIFSESNIDCRFYKNENNDYNGTSMITTVDSLFTHWDILNNIENYVIFLDEFNSILNYIFQADTCLGKTRTNVWKTLIEVLKRCKGFFCVDADVSDLCVKFLKSRLINRNFKFIQNTYKHNKNVQAVENYSLDTLITNIQKSPKFMVCCDSKKSAEFIYLECKTKQIDAKLITGMEKLEGQSLDDFERVIFSPAVLYGLDSTMKRPVFIYHKEHTIDPANMLQQVSRCRNIEKLYFCFQKKKFNKAKYNSIEECRDANTELVKFANGEFNARGNWETRCAELFSELYIDYLYKQDAYNTNKYVHFKVLLTERGFNVFSPFLKTDDVEQKKINTAVRTWKEEELDLDSEYVRNFNERYLGNLTKPQLEEIKNIFIVDGLYSAYSSLNKYFHKGSKNDPLFFRNIKGTDDEKDIRALTADMEWTYNHLDAQNDFNVKKIKKELFKMHLLDKFKIMSGFKSKSKTIEMVLKNITLEEEVNDSITCSKVPSKEEWDKFYTVYKTVFGDRSKKSPVMETKYDCEKMLHKIMKNIFSKDLFKEPKKCRRDGKLIWSYEIEYEGNLMKLTHTIREFRRTNEIESFSRLWVNNIMESVVILFD
tara:strand:+ start:2965 stop:6039 length:3075 start_codon:yes stop_codon:yes gene_type:complete